MILPTIALVVLAIVVLAFVLEPILRARSDAVVLDAAALPRPLLPNDEDVDADAIPADEQAEPVERRPHGIPTGIEPHPASDAT